MLSPHETLAEAPASPSAVPLSTAVIPAEAASHAAFT
jgi:hypothetical protein